MTGTARCRSWTAGLLLCAVAAVAGGCTGSDAVSNATVTGLTVPDVAVAGEAVDVVVAGTGTGEVAVDVIDAYAVTTFVVPLDDGRATVALPPALTSTTGVLGFVARTVDPAVVADEITAQTEILAGTAADTVDVHAGPRTIIADADDQTMVTAIPTDAFGNPLRDDERVMFSLTDADTVATVDATVEFGIVARLVASGTRARSVEVFATADGDADVVSSRRVGYDEVPGRAIATTALIDESAALIADGRQLLDVTTSVIVDAFGNRLLDGHLVHLETTGPDGVGLATATTIDGIARFRLLAPSAPGTVTLTVSVDGTTGEPVTVEYEAAVSSIPAALVANGDRTVLEVGPVLDQLGAVVSDGIPVTVSVDGRPTPIEVPLRGGSASIDLGVIDTTATVEVDVLGVLETVTP